MVAQVHEGHAFSKLLTTLLQGREGGSTKCGLDHDYVNLLQQKRMNAYIGFDTALHHTPLLRAMLHADHAFEEAVHGASKTDDPMTVSPPPPPPPSARPRPCSAAPSSATTTHLLACRVRSMPRPRQAAGPGLSVVNEGRRPALPRG